ncbi:hypothetical protein B6I21_03970 [candidate division KSB1 bacterium 4572_119]|nr:MAG: hypothetical protein B6I21_03970 [candidate division KSB1 bacterium 4572_119]
MKKSVISTALICSILLLVAIPQVQAQAPSATTLKVGYFNPKGAKAGFLFGGSYSWVVDESVDFGIAVDYFRKNYTQETTIAQTVNQDGTVENEIATEAEFTTNILPIYGVINVKFPAGTYLDYFASGGLGYAMLFSSEETFIEGGSKNNRFYSGLKWLVTGGIMYRVGSRSSFLAEVFYDGTKVSRDKKNEEGAPTRYEVDLSGIGFRVGIRMGFH